MPQNRLKQLREQHGLTQIELGNRMGVTQQSVFAWEHGITSPQIQTAITLCKMYNVSLDYLMGLSDDPQINTKPADKNGELKNSTINRIKNLPEPVLSKLLDLIDEILTHRESDSAPQARPDSSASPDR